MWFGYKGRVLEVDLTERKFDVWELSEDDAIKFLGGSGLNAWFLYRFCKPTTAPFDPENPLIFGAGPLVGTEFPTSARAAFTAISPLTGIFGDSNGGGHFAVRIKESGYDHLIIKGISDSPCCLIIGPNGKCEIKDASDIWGKDTLTTDEMLRQKYPKRSVSAYIGPAGENLVKYANIMSHKNSVSFSRTGMGAIMGSKKLKAIVALGGEKIISKEPETMKAISRKILGWVKDMPGSRMFKSYATAVAIDMYTASGLIYGNNWSEKLNLNDVLSIDPHSFKNAADIKDHGCYRCPLVCTKHWHIKEGPYKGEEGYKYEVGHIIPIGGTLGIRDVSSILHLVNQCNLIGIDVMEFGGVAGMAIDAYKQGIINKDTTDGIDLNWGDGIALEKLIQKIGSREGLGDSLAEGTKLASQKIGGGAEKYALHMKGMHWPGQSAPPFVMAFALSTRGGDFLKGMPFLILQKDVNLIRELFGGTDKTAEMNTNYDKGRAVWWHENFKIMLDCLGPCFFLWSTLISHGYMLAEHIAEGYRAATGFNMDGNDLMMAGERAYQVEKAFNALRGINRSHDSFEKKPDSSWAKGIDFDSPGMLDEYYAYRGCSRDGLPTLKRLEEVGLGKVASDLKNKNILGTMEKPENYLPLSTLIKNPSEKKIAETQKGKIEQADFMNKMIDDPEMIRKVCFNIERKNSNS